MNNVENREIYSNDGLNRKEFVDKIIKFIDSFSDNVDGVTILLNGQFGSGKSTVFKYLKEELESKESFQVVEYNTWESNFFDNPLFPLLNALNGLKPQEDKIKNGAISVFKKIPKMGLGTLENLTGIDASCLLDENKIFTQFDEYKNAITDYRKILEDACEKNKTVLLVDELDRCLPEYQIKVLETMHHLLGIQNLVVIIAIDKAQLEKTIETQFGTVNTYGYLAKFIDYELELSSVGTLEFLYSNVKMQFFENIENIFFRIYEKAELSVRDGLKIIQSCNLIYAKLNGDEQKNTHDFNFLFINLVLIIKQKEPTVYKKWFLQKAKLKNEKIIWENSQYVLFLNDISGTFIEQIIDDLAEISDFKDQFFLCYFINYFDTIHNFEHADLEKYLRITTADITFILKKLSYINYGTIMSYIQNLV